MLLSRNLKAHSCSHALISAELKKLGVLWCHLDLHAISRGGISLNRASGGMIFRKRCLMKGTTKREGKQASWIATMIRSPKFASI